MEVLTQELYVKLFYDMWTLYVVQCVLTIFIRVSFMSPLLPKCSSERSSYVTGPLFYVVSRCWFSKHTLETLSRYGHGIFQYFYCRFYHVYESSIFLFSLFVSVDDFFSLKFDHV